MLLNDVIHVNNSLVPCISRLARNCWKPGNISGCEIGGGTRGLSESIGVDPMARGGWSRSGCNKVSPIT